MVAYFASQFQICTGHSWNSGLFQALFKWKCANYIKNPASFDKFCFPNFKELPLIVANTTSVIPGTWTRVQSVPPVPFEFPAEHTPARRASAGHVVVISVLPQNTVIYACCPRYLLKHRCFRCNSDRTLLDNADSGPNQRFCSFSSKNIAQSHAAEWFRDQWTWRQTSQPFFFFFLHRAVFRQNMLVICCIPHVLRQTTSPTSTQLSFFSRLVCVPRPFFLVTASRTRI